MCVNWLAYSITKIFEEVFSTKIVQPAENHVYFSLFMMLWNFFYRNKCAVNDDSNASVQEIGFFKIRKNSIDVIIVKATRRIN